jgi:hypothetical protein
MPICSSVAGGGLGYAMVLVIDGHYQSKNEYAEDTKQYEWYLLA